MDKYISREEVMSIIANMQVEVTNGCILKEILSLLNTQKDGD